MKNGWQRSLLILTALLMIIPLAACSPLSSPPPDSSNPASSMQPAPLPANSPVRTVAQATSSVVPASSASSTPAVTTSSSPLYVPPTSPIYTPAATSYKPAGTQVELFQYILELINQDRQAAGLNPVVLNYNAAAQMHAQDMLNNNYQAAHWGTDGFKPYMRYTAAGGLNYEMENSAYYSSSKTLDLKEELKIFEYTMIYDDSTSNWTHKDNILNRWHKKVNLGIAYSSKTITLVQQFEGDYVEYSQPPTLKGKTLDLTGCFSQPGIKMNNISIAYDPPPQSISPDELTNNPRYHSYSLGEKAGQIFPPPPPGRVYDSLPANSIIASRGSFDYNGWFYIEADISPILSKGPGVYTVVLVALIGSEPVNLTNYSLFVN